MNYVEVPSGRADARRYAAVRGDDSSACAPVTIQSWMDAVSSNSPEGAKAASDLTDIIKSSPYASLLFETPGASWTSSGRDQFEFALVNEPALQRFAEANPDRGAFDEHFTACLRRSEEAQVCSFANLGGDAMLVSPVPLNGVRNSHYSHLAAFLREAPRSQVSEFWRLSAQTYLETLKRKHKRDEHSATWFSTNGMGVSWLHLRLDSRPKYYSYGPFTREPTADTT